MTVNDATVRADVLAAGADRAGTGQLSTADGEKLAIAAREFEAMFLLQMLKQMRQSMLGDEVEEPGLGAATMTDTFDVELSRQLAGQRGGLSDVVRRSFGLPSDGPEVEPPVEPHSEVLSKVPASAPDTLRVPDGPISSPFGPRIDPLNGDRRFHRGVDIAAAYGQPVHVAGDGRVVFAGTQRGYGQTVVVEHADGVQTRYAHLSKVDVQVGETVESGSQVGKVGQSGRATGPHLHFEVVRDGQAVDPRAATVQAAALKSEGPAADYPGGNRNARVRAALEGAGDENRW